MGGGIGEMGDQQGEPVIAIHCADLHEILVAGLTPNMLSPHIHGVRFEPHKRVERTRIPYGDVHVAMQDQNRRRRNPLGARGETQKHWK